MAQRFTLSTAAGTTATFSADPGRDFRLRISGTFAGGTVTAKDADDEYTIYSTTVADSVVIDTPEGPVNFEVTGAGTSLALSVVCQDRRS